MSYKFTRCFYLRTSYPWSNDEYCKNITTVFNIEKTQPLVALASFPNSGNTWVRYMVEGITGVFTGSFLKHSWNGQSISVYDENGKMDVTTINQIYLHMFKIIMMVQCLSLHLILLIITFRLFWGICAS